MLDLLFQHNLAALNTQAGKSAKVSDIRKWDLDALINASVDLSLLNISAAKFSHTVREYRNLVHPGLELRSGLGMNEEEANIAFNVLNLVQKDLSP